MGPPMEAAAVLDHLRKHRRTENPFVLGASAPRILMDVLSPRDGVWLEALRSIPSAAP